MEFFETLLHYLQSTGFAALHWTNLVMLAVGCGFIYLAVRHKFEPLLLVPIGFGILIGNIPYDPARLALGVYDGPASEAALRYYRIGAPIDPASDRRAVIPLTLEAVDDPELGRSLVRRAEGVMVNTHQRLSPRVPVTGPGLYPAGGGQRVLVDGPASGNRYPVLWSIEKQDAHNASIFWWLFAGVGLAGFYPPLIFLGIGALTDFGPMLANPRTLLLGAAAQFGIFASLLGAVALGFSIEQAASIGIIGGADGPTAIFTCSRLAPELLGPVALAAYAYMAMVPLIQPPIIRLLTTREERMIRMKPAKPVSRTVRIIFPIAGFLVTAMLAPGGLPLLGMLFLGNLLRESLVTDRLAKTAQTAFIDIVTILLGVTVGAKTSAANFLSIQTISIFLLGIGAFAIATASGVLFGKLLNAMTKDPVNPMIGAAGVSAVPMSARVVHKLGQEADPQNFLLMHAMGPNVAGVIGSAVAAGVLLSKLAGGN